MHDMYFKLITQYSYPTDVFFHYFVFGWFKAQCIKLTRMLIGNNFDERLFVLYREMMHIHHFALG